jgi:hypothetical protein
LQMKGKTPIRRKSKRKRFSIGFLKLRESKPSPISKSRVLMFCSCTCKAVLHQQEKNPAPLPCHARKRCYRVNEFKSRALRELQKS